MKPDETHEDRLTDAARDLEDARIELVAQVKAARAAGMSLRAIAEAIGASPETVRKLAAG